MTYNLIDEGEPYHLIKYIILASFSPLPGLERTVNKNTGFNTKSMMKRNAAI